MHQFQFQAWERPERIVSNPMLYKSECSDCLNNMLESLNEGKVTHDVYIMDLGLNVNPFDAQQAGFILRAHFSPRGLLGKELL